MFRDVFVVMRFELVRMLGSFRALLVFLLYGAATLLTGLFYVAVVRGIEEQAVEMLSQQGGAATARGMLDITQVEAYKNFINTFTGGDTAKAEFWLATSPMVIVSFFLALGLMPMLVSFVAHDVIARDTELRTLRFVRPKSPIESWVVGKFAAHALLIFVVTVLSGLELFALGVAKLENFQAASGLISFAQFWWRLIVYELGFLGVTFALSALSRTSFSALISGNMALFGLWIIQFFSMLKEDGELRPIGYLSYLSPFNYNTLLWNPMGPGLLQAIGAYLAFAVLGVAATIYLLKARDL